MIVLQHLREQLRPRVLSAHWTALNVKFSDSNSSTSPAIDFGEPVPARSLVCRELAPKLGSTSASVEELRCAQWQWVTNGGRALVYRCEFCPDNLRTGRDYQQWLAGRGAADTPTNWAFNFEDPATWADRPEVVDDLYQVLQSRQAADLIPTADALRAAKALEDLPDSSKLSRATIRAVVSALRAL